MKPRNAVPSSAAAAPPWIDLPRDVTANILHRLGAVEILETAQKVCTTWRAVCKEPAMWRVIDVKKQSYVLRKLHKLETLCRHAVNLSQGQLIGISIEYFGNDELLRYISERSSQLKCLRLAYCPDISGKGLKATVKKYPDLEELHLIFMSSILAKDIEDIGRSCPKLKSFSRSFTFNVRGYIHRVMEDNECAHFVAENMHDLRHLELFGNKMTNNGLQAILDGCPYLESLDLRRCFNVRLVGDLGKRCSQQIKDLKHPADPADDYKWDVSTDDHELFYDSSFGNNDIYSVGVYEDLSGFICQFFSDDEA